MKIDEKLIKVQAALKAPKSQYNKFGGYSYRNCEDILEAAKPLCLANGCAIYLTDEIFTVGSRVYVKATAHFRDVESDQSVSATAYAREEEIKKGMDGSQVTGSASSYARKYALNGLLCIDDTKDADSVPPQENGGSVVHRNSAAASGTPTQSRNNAADRTPKPSENSAQNHEKAPMGAVVEPPIDSMPDEEPFDTSVPIYATPEQVAWLNNHCSKQAPKIFERFSIKSLEELSYKDACMAIQAYEKKLSKQKAQAQG